MTEPKQPEHESRHQAKLISLAITKSQKKKTPAVSCQFRITTGDSAGYVVSWDGWLSKGAIEYTVKGCRALGWQGRNVAELPPLFAAGKLGAEVSIQVSHEEYLGAIDVRVAFVNPLGSGGEGIGGAELAALGADLEALVAESEAPKGAEAAAGSQNFDEWGGAKGDDVFPP